MTQKISNTFKKLSLNDKSLTPIDRSFGIQKIFELHKKKEYKHETLFQAANIMDRYINIVGLGNI